jgi:hypothetical protein
MIATYIPGKYHIAKEINPIALRPFPLASKYSEFHQWVATDLVSADRAAKQQRGTKPVSLHNFIISPHSHTHTLDQTAYRQIAIWKIPAHLTPHIFYLVNHPGTLQQFCMPLPAQMTSS